MSVLAWCRLNAGVFGAMFPRLRAFHLSGQHQQQEAARRWRLHRITQVAGISIHNIINDKETKRYVEWEWKNTLWTERHMAAEAKQRGDENERRFNESVEYWKQGVLPPWAGGPRE